MKIINLLGGNISNYFEKKEIHFLTLVGDSDLIKHVILDLHYADKIFVSEAFSDHNEYRPLSAVSIYTSIKIFNKSVKGNSDAVLICDSEIDSLYKKKIFKIKKSIFNLSEIVDDLFWDYLLYRPLLQFRKNNNIPIVLYFFPRVTKVDNRSDNENRLIQNATTIAKVRTELKKGLLNEIPEALKNQSLTVEQANEITSAHSKVKINGIITSADKQSQYVNVFNGARRTFYQPDEYDGTIYFFGNSRVFGIGAEDKDTIESHFQYLLNYYIEQNNISRRLVVNQANVTGRNFFKMFPLMNSINFQTNDIIIVPGHNKKLARKYGFIICHPQSAFNRPHDMGEVFIDTECHLNSKGNKKVAECLLETFLENDLLSGNYQNENMSDLDNEFPVENENEYSVLLNNYKTTLSQIRKQTLEEIGSIVMNCNPFTLGHRYLIEYAANKVKHLFIFIVEEDKSFFSFVDRFELVKAGIADIKNVTVLPSGQFIISSLTFGDYFDKTEIQDKVIDPSNDVELFAKEIAPSLGITIRFAGEEPLDNITRQYNDVMRRILPKYDIEFEVIPRKESNGEVISASRVRKLLETKDFESIARIVPESTLTYLKARFS